MVYKKESLEKLLLLIDEICNEEENLWFKNALKIKFNNISTKGDFSEFFMLLKKQYKLKANNFYSKIADSKLKSELIYDYTKMLKYQSINDIGKFILQVFYQMENMLNYYAVKSNCCMKINNDKNYYQKKFSDKFIVVCYDNFFYKENPKEVEKINIWAKIVYWALDTSNNDYLETNSFTFSNLINIRNQEGHRNSLMEQTSKSIDLSKTLNSLKTSDFSNLSFYINILKKILETLKNIDTTIVQHNKDNYVEMKNLGVKVVGKIDIDKYKK